jgi:hypothetical protein
MRGITAFCLSALLLGGFWLYKRPVPCTLTISVPASFSDSVSHEIEWIYVHNPAEVDSLKDRHISCFLNGRQVLNASFPEIIGETSATDLGTCRLKEDTWILRVEDHMSGETISTNFTPEAVLQIEIWPNPLRIKLLDHRTGWAENSHNKKMHTIVCRAKKSAAHEA